MSVQWKLNGGYFEACNCDAACPCVLLGPPTTGECTVLVAWHIDKGHFGTTNLDGLNTVLAAYSPGHMLQAKWKVALYVEERASEVQRQALTKIFAGQAGGHLANLAPCIGEVLGIKAVRIDYHAEGRRRSMMMEGFGSMEIEGVAGQNGGDVTSPACRSVLSPESRPLLRSPAVCSTTTTIFAGRSMTRTVSTPRSLGGGGGSRAGLGC